MPDVKDVIEDTEEKEAAEEVLGGEVGHPPASPASPHPDHLDHPDHSDILRTHPGRFRLMVRL